MDLLAGLGVLALCILLHFKGMGSCGLYEPWEPKYTGAVREMVARDDLITPHYRDKERWTKPILIYWAMYASMQIGDRGLDEVAARLPSAISATLASLFLFVLLRRLQGRSAAVVAALVMATTPQVFYMARQATPDMLMVACLTGAMTFFGLGRFGGTRPRLHYSLFGAFVGLAFLAKGPVTGAVVVGALALFLALDFEPGVLFRPRSWWRELIGFLKRYHVLAVAVSFTVVASTWYVPIMWRHGNEFIESFIVGENLHRFSAPVRGHDGQVTYYFLTMLYGMYPWVGFVPFAFAAIGLGNRPLTEAQRARAYTMCWFLSPVILFSISGTKIDHYILPVTPALAALVGLVFQDYFSQRGGRLARLALLASIPILWLCIQDFYRGSEGDYEGVRHVFDVALPERGVGEDRADDVLSSLSWLLVGWSAAAILAACRLRSTVAAGVLVAVVYAHAIYQAQVLYPKDCARRSQRSVYEMFLERSNPDTRLLIFDRDMLSLRYYMGDRYEQSPLTELSGTIAELDADADFCVIVGGKIADGVINILEAKTERHWVVVGRATSSTVLLAPFREQD